MKMNQLQKYNPWSWLQRLHRDDRGPLGVLLVLIMFALVGLLAMLWNTAEFGTRRQVIQNAADSTAHSSAMWMARTLNGVAAQNMVVCQDAAAETIWRAVPAADIGADVATPSVKPNPIHGIKGELNDELALANAMLKNPQMASIRKRLLALEGEIQNEHDQTQQYLGLINGSMNGNFSDPLVAKEFADDVARAISALGWVNDTYVGGAMPPDASPAPKRPGPPGPNNTGLAQLVLIVDKMLANETKVEERILNLIISYINGTEMPIVTAFETRTAPAVAQQVDQQMATHEKQIFDVETKMVTQVPGTIEAQRAALATFHKTDVTLATVQNDPSVTGPAQVSAPCVPADQIETMNAVDTITGQSVTVDPINPQTGKAAILYPDTSISVNVGNGKSFSYTLECNVPGGWGHIWAFPVERYYEGRVWNDQSTINKTYMVTLDNSRNNNPPTDLLTQIRAIEGLPAQIIDIANLPGTIPDVKADDTGAYRNITVLPHLTAPADASAKFRQIVDLYNQHAGKYTSLVRALRNELMSFVNYFNRFTDSFASDVWGNAVANARDYVITQVGTNKRFMVLSCYKLRNIPTNAQAGMRDSAALVIADQIVNMNVGPITNRIVNDLIATNPQGYNSGSNDASYTHDFLYGRYIGLASQLAIAAINQVAPTIAAQIANDWISRPWPYEITPPTDTTMPQGIGTADRLKYFTVVAGARQQTDTAAKLLLPSVFGINKTTLVAYAQAEAFNWMEFNKSYGGSERFDQASIIPYGYGWNWRWGQEYIPCPRGWRLCTVGGWNWQPRLAFADALGTTLQNNSELSGYMGQSGLKNGDQNAIDNLNDH